MDEQTDVGDRVEELRVDLEGVAVQHANALLAVKAKGNALNVRDLVAQRGLCASGQRQMAQRQAVFRFAKSRYIMFEQAMTESSL